MSAAGLGRQPGAGAMAKHLRGKEREDDMDLLERELQNARGWARKLWNVLKARKGWEPDAFELAVFFGEDGARVVEPAFEAAEIVWRRHHVSIYPVPRILDGQVEGRDFIGAWPDGSTRNLSRGQLLMMAGMDAGQ